MQKSLFERCASVETRNNVSLYNIIAILTPPSCSCLNGMQRLLLILGIHVHSNVRIRSFEELLESRY